MSIDLTSNDTMYAAILGHREHKIVCIAYGWDTGSFQPHNVAIECHTCNVVLLDADRPDIHKNAENE